MTASPARRRSLGVPALLPQIHQFGCRVSGLSQICQKVIDSSGHRSMDSERMCSSCGLRALRVTTSTPTPRISAGIGCRNTKQLRQPRFAVGPVVGEGLARPLAGDEDTATRVAEVVAAVRFAFALARHQPGSRILRGNAVAQPVRARR
jgi:hypothetical protein